VKTPGSNTGAAGHFTTTCWPDILEAREGKEPEAHRALDELCRSYWYPIYAFIRRRGYTADVAEDLTQDFFAAWLERDFLASVAPDKGRFRSFLLVTCKNFLANRRVRDHALKRGGGRVHFSIDVRNAEGRYLREPAHELTAERLYERRWAVTLLENVLHRLGAELQQAGKQPLFDQIAPALLGRGESAPYSRIAAELGMTENAVKLAAHRLRTRYRELLVDEVASTVSGREDVDNELRELFATLAQ